MTIDQLIQTVRADAKRHSMTPTELALAAGLSAKTLRNMFCKGWNPRAQTLRQVRTALDKIESSGIRNNA